MKQGEILNGTYQVIREIGKGGTGTVYLAWHLRLQKYVAVKQLYSRDINLSALRREVDILKNLKQANLPQVYDFMEADGLACTVMEYIQGTALNELSFQPGTLDEGMLWSWFSQLAEALVYLGKQKPAIIHSDIKPGNVIIMPDGNVCLIDFNIARGEHTRGKVEGYSKNYASPEQAMMAKAVIAREPSRMSLDSRSDQYSLAAVFYYLISGCTPTSEQPNYPLTKMQGLPYSPGLLALIDRAMSWDRGKRYRSAKDLLYALNHLEKQEESYRRRMTGRAVAAAVCGVLIVSLTAAAVGTGIMQRRQSYLSEYNALCDAAAAEDDSLARESGLAILNNSSYQRILNNNADQKAEILMAVGDSYYREGNYELSLTWYSQALQAAQGKETKLACYESYIVALTWCGYAVQAQTQLAQAQAEGFSGTGLLLARVGVAALTGETADCETLTEELINAGGTAEQSAQACLLTAQAQASGSEEELYWLKLARQYTSSRSVLRRIGGILAELAQGSSDQEEAQAYAAEAIECYTELCGMNYALLSDRTNLAVMLRFAGRDEECLEVLRECEEIDGGNCRVLTLLTMVCYETGDSASARSYCERALESLAASNAAGVSELGDGELSYLYEIADQLRVSYG
ncbi:MAG: serine/threonine protein kinase [Lachnospiraceae bacterium]|nr:serine/threonine protein kinase [Lachnospiraceae bacterium]